MGLAINDYDMIADQDRIVVGVSGGMDSVALLLLLYNRLKRIPIQYFLFPVFVDNFNGKNQEHNQRIDRLKQFLFSQTGLVLEVIRVDTIQRLAGDSHKKGDTCYLCAQKRRNELIKYADRNHCGKIALGHHKDDIIETTLMNILYKQELSSMLPRLDLFRGKIDLIRPLAYIQKNQIEDFIYNREEAAPIFGEVCPSKMIRKDLRREQVREFIQFLSKKTPHFKDSFFAAFRNPKEEYLLNHLFNPKKSGLHRRP